MPDHVRIRRLLAAIPALAEHQIRMVEGVVEVFRAPKDFRRNPKSHLIAETALEDFGDVLRLHHCFSREPFSKDKFEYALERLLLEAGMPARLAPRGTRGYDIEISGEKCSLKTEAAKAIKDDFIHISKFMELGKGTWGDDPKDLEGLRDQFLENLAGIHRVLMLRALRKGDPEFAYELVEIPVNLLSKASTGKLSMAMDSRQRPKPGYCHVEKQGKPVFALYFDGGTERKLQIKDLDKKLCLVHATWRFSPPVTHS